MTNLPKWHVRSSSAVVVATCVSSAISGKCPVEKPDKTGHGNASGLSTNRPILRSAAKQAVCTRLLVRRFLDALLLLFFCLPASASAQREFGFDNTKPSGQPYLTPEESVKRMTVPPGWEVKVFAAEPDIINPIAFTVDERGRLWVVECYEYPSRTPKDRMPRDRIVVLEDTTGSGHFDKRTVWAEGKDFPVRFDMASGIEVGRGGVFLGAAPYLFFLQDTKGTGKCDKFEILLSGFGSQDTHEILNTFQWGPDGWLYGLHGVFTTSKVTPTRRVSEGSARGADATPLAPVELNAGVWRYQPETKKFEIFAEGTSNPWGMDFDNEGNCFVVCCVIPHLFHIIPGGVYKRQAGTSFNPYAYGYLNEISDHTHHKESGWAHAGLLIMQGSHVPDEYQNSVLMGSIHGCSIKRDVLRRHGSTFIASHAPDFLISGDKNFRPINLRWAPDGGIYVIDWHDQNPCHQAAAGSWDYTHGRVYKIQRKGMKATPHPDMSKKRLEELVHTAYFNDNPWAYRSALRTMQEKHAGQTTPRFGAGPPGADAPVSHTLGTQWVNWALHPQFGMAARWRLSQQDPRERAWTARMMARADVLSEADIRGLKVAIGEERDPRVRLEITSAILKFEKSFDTVPLLHELMHHREDGDDPCIPLLIWLAYEPKLTQTPSELEWLRENAPGNPLITDHIIPRAMRRLVATGKPELLALCLAFVGDVKDNAARMQALSGLVTVFEGRTVDAPKEWAALRDRLSKDADDPTRKLLNRLAVSFRDPEAAKRAYAALHNLKPASSEERVEAVRQLALLKHPDALNLFMILIGQKDDLNVGAEAARALATLDDPRIGKDIVSKWATYPKPIHGDLINTLSGRKEWAGELLQGMADKKIDRMEVSDNAILRIRTFRDKKLDAQIKLVWGQVRDTPAELNALIDKLRGELAKGPGSYERGRKVFENQCAKCHKFEGKGHDVGPNLDGAARDIDYLLVNVIDPNRVVGQPYFTRYVTLKNGRVETGLLAAEDEQTLTLKNENDALKVIPKKEIEELTVQERSLMPEGLANNMKIDEFRDLIRYVMANPFLCNVSVSNAMEDLHRPMTRPSPTSWATPAVGLHGAIPLPPVTGQKEMLAYVKAEVTAPTAMRVRLQVSAKHTTQAWVGGGVVQTIKPSADVAAPDQAGVTVDLAEGTNQLFLQVSYRGEKEVVYARFIDPERKLRYLER
jgi:putative membrane-bound dehydrogenase-like protein